MYANLHFTSLLCVSVQLTKAARPMLCLIKGWMKNLRTPVITEISVCYSVIIKCILDVPAPYLVNCWH